jgi:hypothetical protein
MRNWWAKLPLALQIALMTHYPERLGNANGLPAEVRDEANRIKLDEDYERIMAKGGPVTEAEKNVVKVVEQIRNREYDPETGKRRVDPVTGEPLPVQLYIYQPDAFNGDGRIAIAVGNLDEADHVAVNVRGATNTEGLTSSRTVNIYDEARMARSGSGDSVAVLDWMGYDAPNAGAPKDSPWDHVDAAGVSSADRAYEGAGQLAADVDGLRASRSDDPAHLTVIGHSYGSTVAGIAAQQNDLDADDVVHIGSTGVPGFDPGESQAGHDHTWAATGSRDGKAGSWVGLDPTEGSDARRFPAEHVDRDDAGVDNHTHSYYDDDSEGLFNLGAIVAGEYGDVGSSGHRDDPRRTTRRPTARRGSRTTSTSACPEGSLPARAAPDRQPPHRPHGPSWHARSTAAMIHLRVTSFRPSVRTSGRGLHGRLVPSLSEPAG